MKNSFFNITKDTTKGRRNRVIIGSLILIAIYFTFKFLKNNFGFGIPCIFHEITGFYCPGCGITRAIESVISLNFYQAFRYNMLVTLLLPFFVVCVVDEIYCYIVDRKKTLYSKIPTNFLIVLLIITILFGILRNISLFDFLAPMDI